MEENRYRCSAVAPHIKPSIALMPPLGLQAFVTVPGNSIFQPWLYKGGNILKILDVGQRSFAENSTLRSHEGNVASQVP